MGNRSIPPMNRLLDDPQIVPYEALLGRETVKSAVNEILEAARREANGVPSFDMLRDAVTLRLAWERAAGLVPVVNATGILLHTNLGRAPLPAPAFEAMREIAHGYSNLEYDLDTGARGSRYDRAGALLREVTGAEDALVVNNCAAAVLLIVDTFAKHREAIVSRGELVEIGGGFRVPDVLRRGGAQLIEVGTTNRTTADDYRRALSPRTALLLRTHASNFRISGFTREPQPADLAQLAREAGVPLVEDLGSGALVDLREYGLPHERTVQEALAGGADLVAFSGDKLLGGPQAGIIVGKRVLIARLKNNPLLRALRVDKVTLAALTATLRCYSSRETRRQIPFFAMLESTLDELRARAQRYVQRAPALEIRESAAYAGGGSLPEAEIPSTAVVLRIPDAVRIAAQLRSASTPIVARTQDGAVMLDLRTVFAEQDDYTAETLVRVTTA